MASIPDFSRPTTLIDSAIRYRGVVLENEATLRFDPDAQKALTREGTRLVYDDRHRLVRFAAGDLVTSGRGFAGSPQIAGPFCHTRVYSIVDPLRNAQPRGDRSFTLVPARHSGGCHKWAACAEDKAGAGCL